MSEKQTINELLMEVAKLRKDNDYLRGEVAYWKQQAQRNDSVSRGCDTDSREKLEADVRMFYEEHECDAFLSVDFHDVVDGWLDRQAAITERERERHWLEIVGASANCNLELSNRNAELQEKVDVLEAELNRTCTLAYDGKWLTCSACGESLQWFGVRTVYKTDGKQERALGVDGVRYCPFCGARIEGGESE